MVETDGFLRALAKGFTAAQLSKLVHPNVVAADITPSFRRQQPKTAGARRKVKKKPPAPRRDKAAPEARRAPLKAVEPNANDAEARLAKLEIEVFHKHRAKDESIRRRMHALSDHVGALGEKTSKMEARVTKVEQQQSARQRSEASAAAGARALAARVTQIDQRVTEQAEATHAQGEKIRTALARLSALQQKQEALGREQQHISTQVLALPRSLDIAPPPPRLSAASHAAAAYASDAPAAAQGSRRSSGGGSSARAVSARRPASAPPKRAGDDQTPRPHSARQSAAPSSYASSSSSSPLSTTRDGATVGRRAPAVSTPASACTRAVQPAAAAAQQQQQRRRPMAAAPPRKADIVPEPWSRSASNLPPRSSYIPLTDEERRSGVSGPPVSHLTGRCGPARQRPQVRTLCESVGDFSTTLRRAPAPAPPPPPSLPVRRPTAPAHLTAVNVSTRRDPIFSDGAVSYDEGGERAVSARAAPGAVTARATLDRQPLICSSHTRAAHERRVLRLAAHAGSDDDDDDDAPRRRRSGEDPDEGGEAPTPGREFGALRDRYMRAFGKGASSKASPDSA